MSYVQRHWVALLTKHLPPSASRMRVWDMYGNCSPLLTETRPDIILSIVKPNAPVGDMDAVLAIGQPISAEMLAAAYEQLRTGGRFIAIDPNAHPARHWVSLLESAGFTRILVEAALEDGTGALMRGERPHTTADTHARIQNTARQDHDQLDLDAYRGPYIYLLVQQTPNKPVWQLSADDIIRWRALVLRTNDVVRWLAFTSLPKAVNFLQPTVLSNQIRDINKVAKFSRDVVLGWDVDVLLNPAPQILQEGVVDFLPIDPALAEASDE